LPEEEDESEIASWQLALRAEAEVASGTLALQDLAHSIRVGSRFGAYRQTVPGSIFDTFRQALNGAGI
jgi:hypothetical protein